MPPGALVRSPGGAGAHGPSRDSSAPPIAQGAPGADWRTQVPPEDVPLGARALGTQEGANAHPLARRMKRCGMRWTIHGIHGTQAMGKARKLVTNGTLAPWCLAPPRDDLAGPATPPAPGCPARWPRHGPLATGRGASHARAIVRPHGGPPPTPPPGRLPTTMTQSRASLAAELSARRSQKGVKFRWHPAMKG